MLLEVFKTHNAMMLQRIGIDFSLSTYGRCKGVKEQFDSEANPDKAFDLSMDLAFTLVDWAMVFKNPGFRDEKEWRIVHTPTDSYEVQVDALSPLRFWPKTDQIVSYYCYDFGVDFGSNLIPEIVVGPKCKMTMAALSHFLTANNLRENSD